MTDCSIAPDFGALDIPMDVWSEPFWEAGRRGELLMPKCRDCGTFRWPAGPFCPQCRTQPVDWVPPGQARIYSFTVIPSPIGGDGVPAVQMPTLVAFDDAPGVRLVSLLVGASPETVAIGAPVAVEWRPAADASVPVFVPEPATT